MALKSLKNDDGKWKFIGMSHYIVWPDHHIVYSLIVSLISRFAILSLRFRGWKAVIWWRACKQNNTKPTKRLLQTSWFQPSKGTHQKTPTILGHSLPRSSCAFPPLACARLSCYHTPLSHYQVCYQKSTGNKKTPLSTHNTTIILFIFQKRPLGQYNFGFRSVSPSASPEFTRPWIWN